MISLETAMAKARDILDDVECIYGKGYFAKVKIELGIVGYDAFDAVIKAGGKRRLTLTNDRKTIEIADLFGDRVGITAQLEAHPTTEQDVLESWRLEQEWRNVNNV